MNDQLRIGDAEREEAQTRLADHYAAGRLDHDEYTQRLDQVWGARTRAELAPVFRDLPGGFEARSARTSTPGFEARSARTSTPGFEARSARTSTPGVAGVVRRRGPRLPAPLMVLLGVLGAIAVVAHLPLILVGAGVWFFFLRGGCGRRMHPRRW